MNENELNTTNEMLSLFNYKGSVKLIETEAPLTQSSQGVQQMKTL